MPTFSRQPTVAGGQTWWTTGHWECLPPSSPYCNSFDYFMWCVFEREVSKCPHITLISLKVMTSAVVTDLDREVIIHTSMKFQSWKSICWRQIVFGISQDGAPRGFDKTSRREYYYSIMGNLSIDAAFDPLHFSLKNIFNAKSSYCFC